MLRFYSAGSRSPFARSRDVGAVIGRGGNAELVCAVMRFCCGVLCLVYARYAVPLRRFVFDHACCLPPVRQTGRLAGCFVPVPPWVVIAGSAFSNRRRGYPAFLVHFGLARFFMAIPTENEGTGERGERRERGTESAARCKCAFA